MIAGLLPAGCGENRVSQPVGFRLAGIADGLQDFSRLVGAQAHGKDRAQGVFLGQSRPSHFLWHTRRLVVYKKRLTEFYFAFTQSPALRFKATTFQQKCPHVSGKVSNQRHPAVTGAGKQRLAMNAKTFQARSLAIEATGDFFRNKITPKIRLSGQWLERAGFRPGHRVQIVMEQPGSLTLRFLEQGKEVAP